MLSTESWCISFAAAMQERDRALNMVAHLQRASRVAKLQELQAQVGVLRDEIANQMALRQGANGEQLSIRRSASPMSPFAASDGAFRPGSYPASASMPTGVAPRQHFDLAVFYLYAYSCLPCHCNSCHVHTEAFMYVI